jgi:hypothetical protein
MTPADETSTEDVPRISANQLATFMLAEEPGKVGIVEQARRPNPAKPAHYSQLRRILRDALANPVKEKSILADGHNFLAQRAANNSHSEFVRLDAERSLEILDKFAGMRNQLAGYDYRPPPPKQGKLFIRGVQVSADCDLLIYKKSGDNDLIGGLIFKLGQAIEEETDTAQKKREKKGRIASTLAYMNIAKNLAGQRAPATKLCWSVDAQSGDVWVAPANNTRLIGRVESACQIYRSLWNS